MKQNLKIILSVVALGWAVCSAFAQGTAFTYQGRLNSGGGPANGTYDFRFRLAADPLANTYVGSAYLTNGIPVTNGLFTSTMDFGPGIFAGSNYWLEVDVRTNGGSGYTVLSPLQALTPTPYAIFANGASNLLGVLSAGQLSGAVANNNLPSSPTVSGTVTAGAFSGNGANVTNVNAVTLNGLGAGSFWQTGGNAGTTPGANYLGTADNQPLEFHVNGQRALRLEPTGTNGSVNLIGGSSANFAGAGTVGAAIGGGGATNYRGFGYTNTVASDFGTIDGGIINTIQTNSFASAIGGGSGNTIQPGAPYSTIGGGFLNNAYGYGDVIGGGGYSFNTTVYHNGNSAGGWDSVVAGGVANNASTDTAVVGGGARNTAGNYAATVAGGQFNMASGEFATIGGGVQNWATNNYATVPGGSGNMAGGQFSFAAGQQAQALHDGAFVWADYSQSSTFSSTATNQFLIRAQGGVGINVNNPGGAALNVAGSTRVSGMLRLGSETNSVPPNYTDPGGLLLRRISSISDSSGVVVARTDTLTLERDGTAGGLLVRWVASPGSCAVNAVAVTTTGALVGYHDQIANPGTTGTTSVFVNSQNIAHYDITFGNSFNQQNITHVVLDRYDADFYMVGTVTSSYNQ